MKVIELMPADEAKTSFWLGIAGMLSLGSAGAIFLSEPRVIQGAYFLVMALISIAAARGTRVGWALLLIIAISVLVEFVLSTQSGLRAAVWGVIVLALLLPSSLRFVWGRSRRTPSVSDFKIVSRYGVAIRVALYGAIGRIAQWEAGQLEDGVAERKSFSVLLWRLGYSSAVLFFIYALTFNIQDGHHRDGVGIVDVIVAISRAGFVVCAFLFVGTVFVAIYFRLSGTVQSPKSEARPRIPK